MMPLKQNALELHALHCLGPQKRMHLLNLIRQHNVCHSDITTASGGQLNQLAGCLGCLTKASSYHGKKAPP
jgi:hypothetical protein